MHIYVLRLKELIPIKIIDLWSTRLSNELKCSLPFIIFFMTLRRLLVCHLGDFYWDLRRMAPALFFHVSIDDLMHHQTLYIDFFFLLLFTCYQIISVKGENFVQLCWKLHIVNAKNNWHNTYNNLAMKLIDPSSNWKVWL